jgi:hypothetical protein
MLTIHIHTGHEKTIEEFIRSMNASGYQFKSRTMQTQTGTCYLVFIRPEAL